MGNTVIRKTDTFRKRSRSSKHRANNSHPVRHSSGRPAVQEGLFEWIIAFTLVFGVALLTTIVLIAPVYRDRAWNLAEFLVSSIVAGIFWVLRGRSRMK